MIRAPKEIARPERPVAEANDAKAKELYGNTATAYGYNKAKRDGALMSSGADWKNTQQHPYKMLLCFSHQVLFTSIKNGTCYLKP